MRFRAGGRIAELSIAVAGTFGPSRPADFQLIFARSGRFAIGSGTAPGPGAPPLRSSHVPNRSGDGREFLFGHRRRTHRVIRKGGETAIGMQQHAVAAEQLGRVADFIGHMLDRFHGGVLLVDDTDADAGIATIFRTCPGIRFSLRSSSITSSPQPRWPASQLSCSCGIIGSGRINAAPRGCRRNIDADADRPCRNPCRSPLRAPTFAGAHAASTCAAAVTAARIVISLVSVKQAAQHISRA